MVSIVMPIYNAERYIKNAIDDILKQTCKDWELVCVDDGSTDQTPEILNDYSLKDCRIKVIRQDNKGAGEARNAGFNYVAGEYTIFLDSDDRYDPELVRKTYREIERNDAEILIFDAYCFDYERSLILPSEWIVKKEKMPSKETFSYDDCPESIFNISYSMPWNKLYKTKWIRENGFRFQDTKYMNDVFWDFCTLVSARRISYLDEKLVRYAKNRSGSISSLGERANDPTCVCRVMNDIYEYLKENGYYEKVRISFLIATADNMLSTLKQSMFSAYVKLFDSVKYELLEKYKILEKPDVLKEMDDWLYTEIILLKKNDMYSYMYELYRKADDEAQYLRGECVRIEEKSKFLEKNKRWVFDKRRIVCGYRIVLYGAGDMGVDYYNQLCDDGRYTIVAWVDRNNGREIHGVDIQSPDIIRNIEFDVIIIAILDKEIQKQIIESLNWVNKTKIIGDTLL